MEDRLTEPDLSDVGHVGHPREQRDVQRALSHWQRNTWSNDCIPLLDTLDFSSMRRDWDYRFLICGDRAVENAVFVTYGAKFAHLIGLPERPVTTRPFIEQIPETYREMFMEGYSKVMTETVPVTLKGTFSYGSNFELFRAVFMPIMLQPNWSKQLAFGSFNCRTVGPE